MTKIQKAGPQKYKIDPRALPSCAGRLPSHEGDRWVLRGNKLEKGTNKISIEKILALFTSRQKAVAYVRSCIKQILDEDRAPCPTCKRPFVSFLSDWEKRCKFKSQSLLAPYDIADVTFYDVLEVETIKVDLPLDPSPIK